MSDENGLVVIPCRVGVRKLLFLHVVLGEAWLWIDSGIAGTPDAYVFPALAEAGMTPPERHLLLITHADVDHFGGLAELRRRLPSLIAFAGVADIPWIESRSTLMKHRYRLHEQEGLGPSRQRLAELTERGGSPATIDGGLVGGEQLGHTCAWNVLHLPGHSPGHLGLWDASGGRAVIGDALVGWGLRDTDGAIMSAPPYFDVDGYLKTIDLIEGLDLDELHTSHFPKFRGEEIAAFLDESRQAVHAILDVTWDRLNDGEPPSLRELCEAVFHALGRWPQDSLAGLADPVSAHLSRWADRGELHVEDVPDRRIYMRSDRV